MNGPGFVLGLAIAALLPSCSKSSAAPAAGSSLVSQRPFDLDVPPHYDPAVPAPLLLALHGYGADGSDVAGDHWGLSAAALAHGVFVAHPNGTPDRHSRRFWNATGACCDFEGAGVDDVAYLTAVIDDVSTRYRIDPRRVWVTGLSNGGFMAHRLACDRPERIAAIVSVAGSTWRDPARCAGGAPVSVLEMHAVGDPRVLYEGGTAPEGTEAYPSVDATVAESAAKAHCTGVLTPSSQPLGFDGENPTLATDVATWSGCPAGVDVERWKMPGKTHIPRVTKAWADAAFGWLERHPKA